MKFCEINSTSSAAKLHKTLVKGRILFFYSFFVYFCFYFYFFVFYFLICYHRLVLLKNILYIYLLFIIIWGDLHILAFGVKKPWHGPELFHIFESYCATSHNYIHLSKIYDAIIILHLLSIYRKKSFNLFFR